MVILIYWVTIYGDMLCLRHTTGFIYWERQLGIPDQQVSVSQLSL